MPENITEPRAEPESVRGAPEQTARGAAGQRIEFAAQRVPQGMTREQHRKERQETLITFEAGTDQPRHGSETDHRAPEIAVIFSLQAKVKRAPANRVDEKRPRKHEGKTFRVGTVQQSTQRETGKSDIHGGCCGIKSSLAGNQSEGPDGVGKEADDAKGDTAVQHGAARSRRLRIELGGGFRTESETFHDREE